MPRTSWGLLRVHKMQTINAIKKLTKSGLQVVQNGNRYSAKTAKDVISFYDQSGQIILIKVQDQNDHDDSMTDYCAGIWCDNITQAIKLAH